MRETGKRILTLFRHKVSSFSQVVHSIYSYRHTEILWGAKFVQAFSVDPQGDLVLDLDRVHELRMLS